MGGNEEQAKTAAAKPWSRHTATKRAAITAAAVRVFARDGFEAATVDEIARAAHVGKQTVYNYFGDKQALFLAAIQHPDGASSGGADPEDSPPSDELEKLFPPGEPPLAVLTRIGEHILEAILAPDRASLHRLTIAELSRHPELQDMWSDSAGDQVTAAITHYLSTLTTAKNAGRAARQFVVLLAAEGRAQSAHGTRPLTKRQRHTIAHETADLILRAERIPS